MANYKFYYQGAFRSYIMQFMRLFSGFSVQYQVDNDGDGLKDTKTCPVFYGDMDRIVANILHKDGQYTATSLPMMSGVMTSIDLNPENRRNNYHQENVTRVRGSDGVVIVDQKVMGVPYKMNMDLSIYTSNTVQMFQLLEQIMMMFNPKLTLQKSDNIVDWTYLTEVELLAVTQETNIPSGTDERFIVYTLSFIMDVWLDFPMKEKENIIQTISANILDNTHDSQGTPLDDMVVDQNTNPAVL